MLTRLKISGFKNLSDVDIRFGPFTCIAGLNGVGKSNLFDAIRFLGSLADRPLIDAAAAVRDDAGRTPDVRSLFLRAGSQTAKRMAFEAQMIIPSSGVDDLGQNAIATATFLKYTIHLGYRAEQGSNGQSALEVLKEELSYFTQGESRGELHFDNLPSWRKNIIRGTRRGVDFISTEVNGQTVIKLHQDKSPGRPVSRLASSLPRTVLSTANAAESPTVLLAKREMQSWRLLQLEPTALRRPDSFTAPTKLGSDGSHLPATLYHLARQLNDLDPAETLENSAVYVQVANRLSELISDVRSVSIDRDEKRELFTLLLTGRDGTSHPARALSDGTLRFLALTVLELNPDENGLICFEEPENGIHPARIPAMLRLLRDIATNTRMPVTQDNPLRQVIINTHSPVVVQHVPDDSLVFAELRETVSDEGNIKHLSFSSLAETWRTEGLEPMRQIARGKLMDYLNPAANGADDPWMLGSDDASDRRVPTRRVVDRPDIAPLLPFPLV